MGKVFGVLLLVLGIWLASQFATGTSPLSSSASRGERESTAARSGAKVEDAYEQGRERMNALLKDE